MGTGRYRTFVLGGGLLVLAVLFGFGLRAIVGGDDPDDAAATTVPSVETGDDVEASEAESDDDEAGGGSTTSGADQPDDSEPDQTTSTSSTTEAGRSTTSAGQQEPSFVELSAIKLTRTGECQSLSVAVDGNIQVTSNGDTTTYFFPENGGLIEGEVGERSSLTAGEQITAPVGDDWTVSVFSREHLAEGAYSGNHSAPGPVSGNYPGPARMQVSYQISESNGQLTISPLVLSAGSDCQTVAPTVAVSFTSPGGNESTDNGTATQKPAPLDQPLTLLDPVRFDLDDGWSVSVFVRDDWSGRSYTMTHDAEADVTEVFVATDAGDPELMLSYSVSIG